MLYVCWAPNDTQNRCVCSEQSFIWMEKVKSVGVLTLFNCQSFQLLFIWIFFTPLQIDLSPPFLFNRFVTPQSDTGIDVDFVFCSFPKHSAVWTVNVFLFFCHFNFTHAVATILGDINEFYISRARFKGKSRDGFCRLSTRNSLLMTFHFRLWLSRAMLRCWWRRWCVCWWIIAKSAQSIEAKIKELTEITSLWLW